MLTPPAIGVWWQQMLLWLLLTLMLVTMTTQSSSSSAAATALGSYGNFGSCADVLQASKRLGQGTPGDGEYLLNLPNRVAVSVYCKDFASGTPREYLTLVSGRSSNYAEIYEQQGESGRCQAKNQGTLYVDGGRTEFYRIRIQLPQLTVNLDDPTFANTVSGIPVSYGTAGDMYSRTASCGPMGQFSVDLTGTPFVLDPSVSWHWDGRYANGSTTGQPVLRKTGYIGCFEDAGDRLMPTQKLTSGSDRGHMTPEKCSQACGAAAFRYFGNENSNECFCGDSYSKHRRSVESQCRMPCTGDRSQSCGRTWRISVYSTDKGQTVSGRCGGYPAKCYPVVGTQSLQPSLLLSLSTSHPCLLGACQQNEICVALTADTAKCLVACNGTSCDISQHRVVSHTADCPMGSLPVQCACGNNTCTGARFNGDRCLTSSGQPRLTCVEEDPGHLTLTNIQGRGSARCPNGSSIVGCSYWDTSNRFHGNGVGVMATGTGTCTAPSGCAACTVYARCQAYTCGCENGATCEPLTGRCICPAGYYGDLCQTFDYCAYYENHKDDHSPACSAGTCQAVPASEIRTFGVGQSDTCIFPFSVTVDKHSISAQSSITYTQCVDDNLAGPPFACGTYFDGVNDYIDLGRWSPGPVYTLAAWVSPAINDNNRRVIVGAEANCRDFGLILQNGRFNALFTPPNSCSSTLAGPAYVLNKWYLVAASSNGTHLWLYVDDTFQSHTQVKPFYQPTSQSFRIGNSGGFANQEFKGYIKSVKVWKRSLQLDEIQDVMIGQNSFNSTDQALHGGMVAHYELGQTVNVSCRGVDHQGDDWTLLQDQEVSGVHCNVNRMVIGQGITVQVTPYTGMGGGVFEVYAEEIRIDGFLTAKGRGYWGGQRPKGNGEDGLPGESYHSWNSSHGAGVNVQAQFFQPHRGGGGGGKGGARQPNRGSASPGGGGGYGQAGQTAQRSNNPQKGQGGELYGDAGLEQLFIGSGGGSGGNALDLSQSPAGGRGGNGGGAIGLYARGIVQIRGHVSVAGDDGQGDVRQASGCANCPAACTNCHSSSRSACWDDSGPGGGGSGGSLYIQGEVVDVGFDKLWMEGGSGGQGAAGGCGGDGGRGRIRVDAVTFRGQLPAGGSLHVDNSTTSYQDLSIPGQKLIRYTSDLQYGNEVFRGCYVDSGNRHFATTITATDVTRRSMTPQYCIEQCRKHGFAFSAVEYSFECYCDNALKTNLLRPDSECHQACSGDRGQVCGGSYRMSVYGPKPMLPVLAHNGAVQQCRPWCITGNVYSPSPTWGYCDLSSQTSTSFNIRCQCPAGFIGVSCDQACPAGAWGLNCVKLCTCNTTTTQTCNPQDGSCDCLPGYTGPACNQHCPAGTFGHQCAGQCKCPETSDCDFATGRCRCKPGWKGDRCQFPCPSGTYGQNCSQSCHCYQGSCSPEHGTCSCDPGYKMPFCRDSCDPNTYGPNCMETCACHGQPCEAHTGICLCNPGYTGARCEKICPHGTWGAGCHEHCQCQNEAGCDHVSGECDCPAGWTGEHCDITCATYMYGRDCTVPCDCVQQNSESCDGVTGVCTCKPGYTGATCSETCPEGYYGAGCTLRCSCYNGFPCDKVTGKCQCGAGAFGPQCKWPCPTNTFGVDCSQTCSPCSAGVCSKLNGTCICPSGSCSTCSFGMYGSQCQQVCQCMHGSCDPQSGVCSCDRGWMVPHCDSPCPAGTYGKLCLSRCQCQHGNCSSEDGSCNCLPGYRGKLCDTPCQAGKFGVNCSGTCVPCSAGAKQGTCDPVTGRCVCTTGYTGMLCDRPCASGYYGDGCQQKCTCQNGAGCNNVDGTCECVPGFTGPSCEQKCDHGHWGPNCVNQCTCSGHWTSCDSSSGECQCAAGFTGALCRGTCPVGLYGINCQTQCTCDTSVSHCSPIDGSCLCLPGYFGPNCDLCPRNTYGVNCSQSCDCSGHGSCDENGVCDCDPGYHGQLCQSQCEQDLYWGKDCRSECDCNYQSCDFRDGLCRCDPGKKGRSCDQACDPGTFGFQCAQVCQCKNGATCDSRTGECHCPPGVDGRYCNQSCPVGKYGVGCGLTCPCSADTACDRYTGQCQCQPGFTGPSCDVSCPPGTWDVNCAMKCSPRCHSGCLPDTGQCRCTARSCPQGYICLPSGLCDIAATLAATDSGAGLSAGQISGIVIGFVLATVIVSIAVFLIMQKRHSAMGPSTSDGSGSRIEGSDNPLYFSENNKDNSPAVEVELEVHDKTSES